MKPPESRVQSSLNWLPNSVFADFSADGLPWKVAAYTHQGPGGQAPKNPVFRPPGRADSRAAKAIDVYNENNAVRCGNRVNRIVVRGRHSL